MASIAEWGWKCMHNLNYSYKLVQLAPPMTNSVIDLNEKNIGFRFQSDNALVDCQTRTKYSKCSIIMQIYMHIHGRYHHCVLDSYRLTFLDTGPLFAKQTDVWPQDLVKSWNSEIGSYSDHTLLKFCRHLSSVAVEVPALFQSDWTSLNPNRFRDFTRSCGHTSVV